MEQATAHIRFADRIIRFLGWLRAPPNLFVLFVAFIVVAGIWAFVGIAEEVTEGDTKHFDEWAVRALRMPNPNGLPGAPQVPIGPEWVREVGRDMTALGGMAVMFMMTLAVA